MSDYIVTLNLSRSQFLLLRGTIAEAILNCPYDGKGEERDILLAIRDQLKRGVHSGV